MYLVPDPLFTHDQEFGIQWLFWRPQMSGPTLWKMQKNLHEFAIHRADFGSAKVMKILRVKVLKDILHTDQ